MYISLYDFAESYALMVNGNTIMIGQWAEDIIIQCILQHPVAHLLLGNVIDNHHACNTVLRLHVRNLNFLKSCLKV